MDRAAVGAPSARQEIVRALKGVQATPKHLAKTTGLPARVVRNELDAMGREGLTKVRVHRSGETLYRLRDTADNLWDGLKASLNLN